MLEQLKKEVYEANMLLPKHGLVDVYKRQLWELWKTGKFLCFCNGMNGGDTAFMLTI